MKKLACSSSGICDAALKSESGDAVG